MGGVRTLLSRSETVLVPGNLGIIFGLFVAFTATQVWTDTEKAKAEIDREASALRSVVILATTFPKEAEEQLRGLIRRYKRIGGNDVIGWTSMGNGNGKSPSTVSPTKSARGQKHSNW
jgi:hypothetical protein